MQSSQIINKVICVRGLRAFADGYVSVLLPVYLLTLGMSAFQVGFLATATLLGSGLMTLVVGLYAWKFNYRTLLLLACLIMAMTGFSFSTFSQFWPLLIIAFVGTLNPSSGDVSVFLPLEHSVLSLSVEDKQRTAAFARYSLVGTLVAALGCLFAGAPEWMASHTQVAARLIEQGMFVLYGAIGICSGLIYATLPVERDNEVHKKRSPLTKSKNTVYRLATLFSIDAFGGGFVVQSLLALWLFQRFHLSIAQAGGIFFWMGLLAAGSYLVAARIANRWGLVNTMVFTHLPSSIFLILIPFVPSVEWAIALLLARGALSQMDVPTRSSYVMAVVPKEERAAAASVTSVPRSLAAATAPVVSGYLLSVSSFGWPLVIAGALKIAYDLLLLSMFRKVRPPEEAPC